MASRLGCAILDADCLGEAFGDEKSEAGDEFRRWVTREGRLVSGGRLHRELRRSTKFRLWAEYAVRSPQLRVYRYKELEPDVRELDRRTDVRSNDRHVLSLARVSGARLLYSRDRRLRRDFLNPAIIDGPGGQLYNRGQKDSLTDDHRELLRTAHPCA